MMSDNACLFAADYDTQTDLEHSCRLDCKSLSTEDYVDLLWTTIAEFPGKYVTISLSVAFNRFCCVANPTIFFCRIV